METKLIDGTPETLETLHQADAFMAKAQREYQDGNVELAATYLEMANIRYQKILVRVPADGPDTVYGSEGKNQ